MLAFLTFILISDGWGIFMTEPTPSGALSLIFTLGSHCTHVLGLVGCTNTIGNGNFIDLKGYVFVWNRPNRLGRQT